MGISADGEYTTLFVCINEIYSQINICLTVVLKNMWFGFVGLLEKNNLGNSFLTCRL